MKRCNKTALAVGFLTLSGLAAAPAFSADFFDQKPKKSWINFFAHSGQWKGKPHVDMFGVIQPSYTNIEDVKIKDTFSFTRARTGLRGSLTDTVSFFFLYEMGNSPPLGPTSGGMRMLDALVNWKFSDVANIRMGQFIPDFGHAIAPGALVSWIDYTDIEKSVWFFNRQGDSETTAARETGAAVWNEFSWDNSVLSYELGVYNGAGLRQVEQTDDSKDIIASVRYATGPFHVKTAYWTGDRKTGGQTVGKKKWAVSGGIGDYVNGDYWLLGEYMSTEEKQPGSIPDVNSDGFYIAAGWRPTRKHQLAYRYSSCDCTDNVGPPGKRDSTVNTFTYTYFIKGNLKILAQYDVRDDDLNVVPGARSNAFRIMFSMPFSYRLTR